MASTRRRKNLISRLKDDSGVWQDNEEEVQKMMVAYFQALYMSEGCNDGGCIDVISPTISNDDNAFLTAPFTEMEIKEAVFSMHPDKSPGPDGMNIAFFSTVLACSRQGYLWSLLKCPLNFKNSKRNERHSNCSYSKKQHVQSLGDLRPISSCNVIYKILAKEMANRMKQLLPKTISCSQGAFILCRSIIDNILISFEVLHYLNRKTQGKHGFAALKVDMSKAYGRVE